MEILKIIFYLLILAFADCVFSDPGRVAMFIDINSYENRTGFDVAIILYLASPVILKQSKQINKN